MSISGLCSELRQGAYKLAIQSASQKNCALECVIQSIDNSRDAILKANHCDVEKERAKGIKESLIDRLTLTNSRIDAIIESLKIVIAQPDPIGQVCSGWTTPNGLRINKVQVPLGVVAIIYESRPNVTVDAFALAYKSGNAILLRGSSSALESNRALLLAIKQGLSNSCDGVPQAVALADSGSHSEVDEILTATGKIDVVLPRGGASLIKMVVEKARIPVIETGSGVCHLFIDESADLEKAVSIAENAKLQRPGVCNAIECIVVHSNVLTTFLPLLAKKIAFRCQFRCDQKSFSILHDTCEKLKTENIGVENIRFIDNCVVPASQEDFGYEFLDTIVAVKTVDNVEQAIDFINDNNTKHSESIITTNIQNATLFQQKIDSSCVYVNASTRFTDGGEFGFGAELGISTQKLHVRGPMGSSALTTTKYFIVGEGQIR